MSADDMALPTARAVAATQSSQQAVSPVPASIPNAAPWWLCLHCGCDEYEEQPSAMIPGPSMVRCANCHALHSPIDPNGKPALRWMISELALALEQIIETEPRPYAFPADWHEQIDGCAECQRYADHPIQQGICDTHRRPIWDREKHDRREREALAYRMREIARNGLQAIAIEARQGQDATRLDAKHESAGLQGIAETPLSPPPSPNGENNG